MAWPSSTDYFEAVQTPGSFSDSELQSGEVTANALGLPRACTGNFADVYQICCANNQAWAVKCFTRDIPGLQERYRLLSGHLQKIRFPFTVDFRYLAQGTRVRGAWYPMLKMRWVEGYTLNTFVRNHLDKPQKLQVLMQMWIKLAKQLRAADIAHGDLQHGNVLLVPSADGKSVRLTLIDYDGMIVPALAHQPSGEVGHPSYQHPERLEKSLYHLDVDRFSHLVICCALQCLAVGGRSLWDGFNNDDNLLFRKEDFADPGASHLFRALWELPDPLAHALVGTLIQACTGPMAQVPTLDELFSDENAAPRLSSGQEEEVKNLLSKPLPAPPIPVTNVRPDRSKETVTRKTPKTGSPPPLKAKPTPADILPADLFAIPAQPKRQASVLDLSIAWLRTRPIWQVSAASAGILFLLILFVVVLFFSFFGNSSTPGPDKNLLARTQKEYNDLIEKADLAFENNRFDDAIVAYETALRINASDSSIQFKLQESRTGKQNQVLNALITKGEQAFEDERFDDAIVAYEAALKINPVHGFARAKLQVARTALVGNLEKEITNSIGMKLVLIPPGEFLMGSTFQDNLALSDEKPQHRVKITRSFYMGMHEVTVNQFRAFIESSKYVTNAEKKPEPKGTWRNFMLVQEDNHPVSMLSWNDAQEFCKWLSEKEKRPYRLPTEAEWEYACRAGTTTRFWTGDKEESLQGAANLADQSLVEINPVSKKWARPWNDGFPRTSPIGTFRPNPFGLYDTLGNAWEWCADRYGPYPVEEQTDPFGAEAGNLRVIRGGAWGSTQALTRCAYRHKAEPDKGGDYYGFRLVLEPSAGEKSPDVKPKPPTAKAEPAQEITNSISMKLVSIPPGNFRMGSPVTEKNRTEEEGPQHEVELTRGFFMGKYEVTQKQYRDIMGNNPSHFSAGGDGKDRVAGLNTDDFPVELVAWDDAVEFCRRLSLREAMAYRLPTEAEWEYACRGGSKGKQAFHTGATLTPQQANFQGSAEMTRKVGSYSANGFGLHDMHGNVFEWCLDRHDGTTYARGACKDPTGPNSGNYRIYRGGSWIKSAAECRSAARDRDVAARRDFDLGFRVVLVAADSK